MGASAVLEKIAKLGVTIRASEKGTLLLEPGSKVPHDLVAQVRQHKGDILVHLGRAEPACLPDYAATACVCPVPNGGTGCRRCTVCELPLICPDCRRCRGCKLRLKFPPNRGLYG